MKKIEKTALFASFPRGAPEPYHPRIEISVKTFVPGMQLNRDGGQPIEKGGDSGFPLSLE